MKQTLKDILKNTVITLLILEWSHQRSHNLTFTFHEKKNQCSVKWNDIEFLRFASRVFKRTFLIKRYDNCVMQIS